VDDKENKLYSDFATRDVLDGISADNFDSLKNEAFITPENKQFFDDMLRVGWLSGQLSSSGPMPNTSKIVTATATASSANYDLFTPAAGEVWAITAFSFNKNGTFPNTIYGYLIADDGAQTTTIDMTVKIVSSTSDPINDGDFGNTFYIDQNSTLMFRSYTSGGIGVGDSIEGQILCTRVR
jgi:hypothetical protein